MSREIVLDTETTGLDPGDGHRIIEIACVEIVDCIPTGRTFHRYVDPGRPVDRDAEGVHGLTNAFLAGKPKFSEAGVADAFLEFVAESPLVAHNAAFDRGFINNELGLAGLPTVPAERWVDTLGLAQRRFPTLSNSLDSLCKRYKLSLAEREKHGALIDARLLAGVYLELRGGRERALDLAIATTSVAITITGRPAYGPRPRVLAPRLTSEEAALHEAFIRRELASCSLWGATLAAA